MVVAWEASVVSARTLLSESGPSHFTQGCACVTQRLQFVPASGIGKRFSLPRQEQIHNALMHLSLALLVSSLSWRSPHACQRFAAIPRESFALHALDVCLSTHFCCILAEPLKSGHTLDVVASSMGIGPGFLAASSGTQPLSDTVACTVSPRSLLCVYYSVVSII